MSDPSAPPEPFDHIRQGVTPPDAPAPPDLDAPPPARPFPLHPNFWWAILWCVFLVLMTQVPGAAAALVVMLVMALNDPEALKDMTSPAVATGLVVAVVVAHGLMILLSLLVLRIVAGRDWMRQVALRLPSLAHVVLALAMLPAFVVLGSAVDAALKLRLPGEDGPVYPGIDRPASAGAFWAGMVLALFVIGLGNLVCRIAGGRDWYRAWIAPRPRGFRWLLSFAVLTAFFGLTVLGYDLSYPLAAEVLPQRDDFTGMEEMVKAFTSLPIVAAVVVIGLFPGLSEELWCRAFLGRGLVGKYGLFWGVLLTSFLFGAIHGDPRQGTMALLMGALLHFSYLTSRSLLIPMLLHFLNNSLAVTLVRVPEVAQAETAPLRTVWPLLASAAVLLGASLFAFWQSRARLMGLWEPEHPGVACPPPQSKTWIVTPSPSVLAWLGVAAGVVLFAASCVEVYFRLVFKSSFL